MPPVYRVLTHNESWIICRALFEVILKSVIGSSEQNFCYSSKAGTVNVSGYQTDFYIVFNVLFIDQRTKIITITMAANMI